MKITNIKNLPLEMQKQLEEKQYRQQLRIYNPGNVSGANYKRKYDTGEVIE